MATRQAVSASMPELVIGLKSTEIMKICVTPPPRLPHPAAVALAVPMTPGANIKEHQNWLVTKVAPSHGAHWLQLWHDVKKNPKESQREHGPTQPMKKRISA